MSSRKIAIALGLAALLAPALCGAADYVIQEKVTSSPFMGQPAKEGTNTIYWSGDKMRVEDGTEAGQILLLRGDQKKLYMLNAPEKSYSEMTFDQLKSMSAMMMAQMGDPGKATVKDTDRKSTRLNSSHIQKSRMPSSA